MLVRDEVRSLIRNKLTKEERHILNKAVTARTPEPFKGFVVNEHSISEELFVKLKGVIREAERKLNGKAT